MMDHYGAIPVQLLRSGTILDIGAGTGEMQLNGRRAEEFLRASAEGRYLGIDLYQQNGTVLHIEAGDLWDCEQQHDVVICSHMIEHFSLDDWPDLFDRLKGLVRPGGWLVLMAPYNEHPRLYYGWPDNWQRHRVSRLTGETLRPFLGDITCYDEGSTFPYERFSLKGLIWWLRCWLRGDRYVPFGLLKRYGFIAFWRKPL